jgi:hypothetical protein
MPKKLRTRFGWAAPMSKLAVMVEDEWAASEPAAVAPVSGSHRTAMKRTATRSPMGQFRRPGDLGRPRVLENPLERALRVACRAARVTFGPQANSLTVRTDLQVQYITGNWFR